MVEKFQDGAGPAPREASSWSAAEPCSGRLRLRRGPCARLVLRVAGGMALVAGFALLAAALVMLRITWSPVGLGGLAPRILAEVNGRLGAGYDVSFRAASIANGAHGPTLAIEGFSLKNAAGRAIVAAPRAEISVAFFPLLVGSVRPTRLDLLGVDLRLTLLADGAVALSVGEEPLVLSGPTPPAPAPDDGAPDVHPPDPAGPPSSPLLALAGALREVVDFATTRESAIGAMQRFGVERGRLVIEHAASGETTVFDGLELAFAKEGPEAHFRFGAIGPGGRFAARAVAAVSAAGERTLDAEINDLSFDEFALATGLRERGASFDMPVSARVRLAWGADGALSGANGGFAAGAGHVVLDHEHGDGFSIDELSGSWRWNPVAGRVDIDPVLVNSGETRLTIAATAEPPREPGAPWRIEARATPGGVVGPEARGDPAIVLDRAELSASFHADEERVVVDRIALAGPLVDISGEAELDWSTAARRLKIVVRAGRMPAFAVLRLWPKPAARPTRDYLVGHVRGGMLERGSLLLDFDAETLAAMQTDAPIHEDRLKVDFTVSNASLAFLPGVPPLTAIEATGRVTGRNVHVNASRGILEASGGRRLLMSDGVFEIPDTNRKPAPATLVARATGPLDAVSDILSREGLKSYGGMQIDTSAMKGQFDGKLNIDLKLAKTTRPGDTSVRVSAAIGNFSIEKLIGKERLEQGVLNVTVEPGGLKASGQGRLFGTQATIELKKPASGPTDAVVQFSVDEAARARMGMNFGPGLTGPVGVRLTAPFGKEDAPAQVELDITRAAIDGLLPGLVKLAGRPAKATFVLHAGPGGVSIDQLNFEAPGGAAARGSVDLDAAGAFRSARLSSLRLSPGDDVKVDADQTKERLKLVVRGNSVDARPFLRGLMGPESASGSRDSVASRDIDLDLKSSLVTGFNRQTFTAVDLRLTRHAGAVRTFHLQAKSGRAQIAGDAQPGLDGTGVINLATADAGAFMSFLDIYKRMEGGKLQMNARMMDSGLDGAIRISDFVLRDEPALRRLVAEGAPPGVDKAEKERIDTAAASFQRLSATFSRGGGRFTVRDGVLLGQQIGLKLDGTLDTARDQINMTGVFVPAFGLNNLFSKIPLFGPILGGDRNEGLFAVNFRIAGQASAPTLTINPLSAIAPGFLRKIFGAIDGTGTPATPAPAARDGGISSRNMPLSIGPARD